MSQGALDLRPPTPRDRLHAEMRRAPDATWSDMPAELAAAAGACIAECEAGAAEGRRRAEETAAPSVTEQFRALRPAEGFGLIMADPPWRFSLRSEKGRGKSAERHYSTMPLAEIEALPVVELAAADCLLWLWATAPMLPLQIRIAEAWGFAYRTSGVWAKRTANGKLGFGTGYVLRSAHEPFVIAARGRPRIGSRSVRSVIEAPLGRHSEKPDAAYAAAEALAPGVRRIELFSRRSRPGWDAWGDEAGKFDGGAR